MWALTLGKQAHGLDFFAVKARLPAGCRVVVWRWTIQRAVGGLVTRSMAAGYEVSEEWQTSFLF